MSDHLHVRKQVAKEKLLQAALFVASDHFEQDEADPGWQAEVHSDMLDEAVTEYANAKAAVEEGQ